MLELDLLVIPTIISNKRKGLRTGRTRGSQGNNRTPIRLQRKAMFPVKGKTTLFRNMSTMGRSPNLRRTRRNGILPNHIPKIRQIQLSLSRSLTRVSKTRQRRATPQTRARCSLRVLPTGISSAQHCRPTKHRRQAKRCQPTLSGALVASESWQLRPRVNSLGLSWRVFLWMTRCLRVTPGRRARTRSLGLLQTGMRTGAGGAVRSRKGTSAPSRLRRAKVLTAQTAGQRTASRRSELS
mmetsp:Transcript_48307/g.151500  ORF Transcript_48307/g.151500 Transcript_48307/m.151500 type:complete len:239 (+) Transcript_48307:803-1519(+)